MGFIENLKNVSTMEVNQSVINDTDNLILNSVNNANDMTDGNWFVVVILTIFIILFLFLMKKTEQELNYDASRAFMLSSFICLILSIVAVLTPITTTFLPVIWFGVIFLISVITTMERKKKGL